jgi:stearoyl-CoA desaturase (delta-9 desaturase)
MVLPTAQGIFRNLAESLNYLDSDYFPSGAGNVLNQEPKSKKGRWIPLIFMHTVGLGVIFVGASATAVLTAIALYWVRMFAITGFYHRYFSHRTFKTSRFAQFVFAALGTTAVQRGPLWWAAHHRNHHQFSDQPKDSHSPRQRGFLWSHLGWITSDSNIPTDYSKVPDLAKFPELVYLNRFDWIVPILAGLALYGFGEWLKFYAPQLGTNGTQMLVWGFVSTIFLYHGTFSINSLAHVFGSRRFETDDDSRNNFLLAVITMGEGWHNNHHRYPGIARQGLMWWEIDCTYYLLQLLQRFGIIWDLRAAPAAIPSRQEQFEPAHSAKSAVEAP